MDMKIITVHLTEKQLEYLKKLVDRGYFPNRSEAIRIAVNDLIRDYCRTMVSVQTIKKEAEA